MFNIVVISFVSLNIMAAEIVPDAPANQPTAEEWSKVWNEFIQALQEGAKDLYATPEKTKETFRKQINAIPSLSLARLFFRNEVDEEALGELSRYSVAFDVLRARSEMNRAYLEANKTLGPNAEDKFLFRERFDTDMNDLSLQGAYLWECKFGQITLASVNLDNGWIVNTHFDECTFNNVSFKGLTAPGLDFWSCTVKNCDFSNAKLPMLEVRESNFENVDFVGADLEGAYFSKDINTINMTGANLCGLRLGEKLQTNRRFTVDGATVDFVHAYNPETDKSEDFSAIEFFNAMGIQYDSNNPPTLRVSPILGGKRNDEDRESPEPKRKKE